MTKSWVRRLLDLPDGVVHWVDEYVQDKERVQRYCPPQIATLPSRHEGFSVAALEAIACALPLVAADVSGVRDLMQASPGRETGIIVPPGDADALADALGRLLDDVELSRRLGSSARSVAEGFSLEDVGTHSRTPRCAGGEACWRRPPRDPTPNPRYPS